MNLTAGDWRRWLIFWWLTGEAGPADTTGQLLSLYSILRQFTEVGFDRGTWYIPIINIILNMFKEITVGKSTASENKLIQNRTSIYAFKWWRVCSPTNEHDHNPTTGMYLSEEHLNQSLYCRCALTSDSHRPPLWPWSSGCSGTCINNKSSSYRSMKYEACFFIWLVKYCWVCQGDLHLSQKHISHVWRPV